MRLTAGTGSMGTGGAVRRTCGKLRGGFFFFVNVSINDEFGKSCFRPGVRLRQRRLREVYTVERSLSAGVRVYT